MNEWRDIPTKYKWDGESLFDPNGVSEDPFKASNVATSVAQVVVNTPYKANSVVPSIPASKIEVVSTPPSVNIDTNKVEVVPPKTELTTEEQAAAARMEAALDKVLALLGQKAETTEPQTNLTNGTPGTPLWDTTPLTLDPNKSAIYPAGRPINNPNHLMFMLWNGAAIGRDYTPAGWSIFLRRGDKKNPIPEKLFDALVKSETVTEVGDGVFRIKER
jgi:hypothetical protein